MKNSIFIMVAVLFFSCSSQLDVPPHSALSGTSVTPKDVPALTNGMYRYCQNMTRETYILNDMLGGLVQRYTHSSALESINYYLQIDNGDLKNIWNSHFTTLVKVNTVISLASDLPETDIILKAKGAAHFMRAYIYMSLVTHWGAVPIIEEAEEAPPRQPVEKVWNFIEQDLDKAILFLKPLNESGSSYYYVTQDAAKGLKARMLLYTNRKNEAAILAEELINSGQFRLDAFEKIFRAEANTEIMFAFLNLSEESSTNLSSLFYNYDHPNSGSYFQRPTNDIMSLFDDTDKRKSVSWTNEYGGVNCFNKYPSGQVGKDPVIVVRIAEMYLISAEGKGLAGGGLARLNELRNFRGLEDYTPTPTTEDYFIEAILAERDKELLTENHRYYDLVRTNKHEKIGLKEHQKLLPIPESERLLNPNLTQNDVY